MRRVTILLTIFLMSLASYGHPSWGIAVDGEGNVYFADVLHNGIGTLWKLNSEGEVSIIARDFHAHYLQLDKDGNLWSAEERWIEGVVEGEGENSLIRISPDGKRETIIFTDDWDEFLGGAFALGPSENVYFTIQGKVWEKPFNGNTRLLIDHKFERIVSLYTDDDFNLWITDAGHRQGTLYRWNEMDGLVEFATGLLPEDPEAPIFEEKRFQLLYGICRIPDGAVFVCENAGRRILRIEGADQISVFYRSEKYWYPAGVAFRNGDAFILEYGYNRHHLGPRIVRLDRDGRQRILFDHARYSGQ